MNLSRAARRLRFVPTVLIAVALLVSTRAHARTDPGWITTLEARIVPSDAGAIGDYFGQSVALNGDTLVVGAGGNDNAAGTTAGAAYVFTFDGTTWVEEIKLIGNDTVGGDQFGHTVAVDAGRIVVGANTRNGVSVVNSGALYVFERIGSVWTQTAKLTASDEIQQAALGESLAVSGDTIVAGAPNSAPGGAFYVFVWTGTAWVQQAKLGAGLGGVVGEPIDIHGDTIVAGAPFTGPVPFNAGAAHVFQRTGSTWTYVVKLTAPTPQLNVEFGNAVSVFGNTIAIGCSREQLGRGTVHVFERVGGSWTPVSQFWGADSVELDQFGSAVCVRGDHMLVGAERARFARPFGPRCGKTYVFERVAQTWLQRSMFVPSDPTGDLRFGGAVVLEGNRALVGARDNQLIQGRAYAYTFGPEATFCFGDGSLATHCPCAAPDSVPSPSGAADAGCANSFDLSGARLRVGGMITPDTLVFTAEIGPSYGAFGFLIKGTANAASGVAVGDGVRCVDGALIRFGGHDAGTSGAPLGTWTYPNSAQTTQVSVATAQYPGESAFYQLVYRNAAPGFCSPATFNLSNAIRIDW